MLSNLKNFIKSHQLFHLQRDKVLLAISGGVDSMVMLQLFHRLGVNAAVAHCNFCLRGKESDEDEQFVIDSSAKLQMPFFVKKFNTTEYARKNNISIQMAARELRYQWFNELCLAEKINYIALAQHKDDKIETFFVNLLRGTGIKGLDSLVPKRKNLIRPLLFADRKQIELYAAKNNIAYRNDSSNASDKYIRNNIRHNILPLFHQLQPSFRDVMIKNMDNFGFSASVSNQYFQDLKSLILKKSADIWEIDISNLKELKPLDKYLYEILSAFNFSPKVCEDLANSILCDSISGKEFNSESHVILKDRDKILIKELTKNAPEEIFIDENSKQLKIEEDTIFEFKRKKNDSSFKFTNNKLEACVDERLLKFPLTIRKWKRGDTFYPLGMRGKKKLSDFFIDNKLTKFDKEKIWVVLSNKEIVWVVGHRIDNRFRITDSTKEIFCLYAKSL